MAVILSLKQEDKIFGLPIYNVTVLNWFDNTHPCTGLKFRDAINRFWETKFFQVGLELSYKRFIPVDGDKKYHDFLQETGGREQYCGCRFPATAYSYAYDICQRLD